MTMETAAPSKDIPVLIPMFEMIDNLVIKGHKLSSVDYLIGGQVCIHKDYRSQGIFYKLYNKAKEVYESLHPIILTEVSTNRRR